MKEPEIVAFAGDWHGNTMWATAAISVAAEAGVQAILHTGDYGFRFADKYVDNVEQVAAEDNVMVYFVDGNHDWHEHLWALPLDDDGLGILSDHVRWIPRGYRWNWWGLDFMGLGGATSVDKDSRKPYVEWWPTESLTYADVERAIYGPDFDERVESVAVPKSLPVDIMVTHDAPSRIPIPGISMREGLKYFSHNLLQQAEIHRRTMRTVFEAVKPKLWVHGHYHKMYQATVEGCHFIGLDCDGSAMNANLWVVTGEELHFRVKGY